MGFPGAGRLTQRGFKVGLGFTFHIAPEASVARFGSGAVGDVGIADRDATLLRIADRPRIGFTTVIQGIEDVVFTKDIVEVIDAVVVEVAPPVGEIDDKAVV